MQLSDFYYDLPKNLIADYPPKQRGGSRLLFLDPDSGLLIDQQFSNLSTLLSEKDLLILNDTKVIPARLLGVKTSGGKVEVLIERILNQHLALAHVRPGKTAQAGHRLVLEQSVEVIIGKCILDLVELHFLDPRPLPQILDEVGRIPLPPYIRREMSTLDSERYQTIYASRPGAIAAPTAGLHFNEFLLKQLQAKGVQIGYITLHVGTGTFQPVRVEHIHQHRMHSEYIEISEQVCAQIQATKQQGGRVIAVGTTTVRALESASVSGLLSPYQGETEIFIFPGYRFHTIDALITNFHLPKSTLLMLVCAFAGREKILAAYQHAVKKGYRFFSYGDAMFITSAKTA
ncbi:S-adenosylmethionine/tRNA-ribosyltransferase-isomerase [Candidatus Nitrosoglobus terrae]|uniref:S-adenosylmethionine:tRNA ribosyltransferase-isomerase n=1 Tax=Candidatus Nitrosoglobus terrae TaxID=1630141 RepID=A0A1Q2SMM8_9GAMM|nr:tRNA preQ1(34) S-adenosylmethionine ribosyltransferase-isomerase QueA [Candidatus Nitrosoglobus terrae]BAW80372.1 S-adenosylmethionine/tRNA-ribosyltransferase-isomerase [Candidatus Nitrosoglobus terrae]